MDSWAHLDIEPTSDKKVIRSAYAKKLKTCRPEDDPQGYEALREAYQLCLRLALTSVLENSQQESPTSKKNEFLIVDKQDELESDIESPAETTFQPSNNSNAKNQLDISFLDDQNQEINFESTNTFNNIERSYDDDEIALDISSDESQHVSFFIHDWISSICNALRERRQIDAIKLFDQQKHILLTLTPNQYSRMQIDLIDKLNKLEPVFLHPRTFYSHIVIFLNGNRTID